MRQSDEDRREIVQRVRGNDARREALRTTRAERRKGVGQVPHRPRREQCERGGEHHRTEGHVTQRRPTRHGQQQELGDEGGGPGVDPELLTGDEQEDEQRDRTQPENKCAMVGDMGHCGRTSSHSEQTAVGEPSDEARGDRWQSQMSKKVGVGKRQPRSGQQVREVRHRKHTAGE